MEKIELTTQNVGQYLTDCLELQRHLVKEGESIEEAQFLETAADSHSYFLGIVNETNQLVGLGVLSKVVHPVRSNGYINNIVVHPDARGQGLFGDIMGILEQKAVEWGCARIELTCSRSAVQGLYQQRGYQPKDTEFYYKDVS